MRFSLLQKYQLGIALLFIVSAWNVSATEKVDSTKVYSIREVTVTEKYQNTEVRSAAPLQILSSKEIKKLNALQVSDAVKYFPGVTVKDYGGIGGLKTVSVRSLGAGHTAVSYDGITLSDCQTGQIDIGRFSLENVDMLSLNNGQSDNIFQPARLFASASVLNIRTLTPQFKGKKTFHGSASMKAGSFGLLNPSVYFQKKLSTKYSAVFSGEWLSANGEYPYLLTYGDAGDSTSHEIRKNTDVNNFRLEGSVYANFSEKQSAYLKAYFYNSDRGLPGATIYYNTDNFSSQRMNDQTFFVQAHYQTDFSQFLSFQANAKYNYGYLHYLDTTYLNSIGREESLFYQREYYGSASFLYRAFSNMSFSFSTDGFVNTLDAVYESASLTNEFARPVRYSLLSVVAAKYVSEQLLGTASLLSTIVSEQVENGASGADHNRLSPYVSLIYKPFKKQDLRLRAFYKNIFRLPTFNDLYYARIGNTDLKPENTDQFNFGLTYEFSIGKRWPLFSFTADGYRNHVKDKIVAMPTGNIFKWTMVNLGIVEVTGLDLTAETTMALIDNLNLILGGTYTYQRALDKTSEDSGTYGHQIPYTPRVSGSGKAAIETPWVDISYALLWSGARYAGFQNYAENRLPGYSDHSISASKELNWKDKTLNLKLEVLNLTDKNYAIVKWFPMPGRSFRATVGMKF